MSKILIALIFSVACAAAAFGQSDSGSQQRSLEAQRAEMKKVEMWAGSWKGSGWIMKGIEKQTFTGTETVQKKLDGLALLVEGKFTNAQAVVIHETLTVLSYDLKTKVYNFDTYLANGSKGVHEFTATPDGWQWDMQFPGGKMRYQTKLSEAIWTETGEITMDDGKTWRKFFEMNLEKVK